MFLSFFTLYKVQLQNLHLTFIRIFKTVLKTIFDRSLHAVVKVLINLNALV